MAPISSDRRASLANPKFSLSNRLLRAHSLTKVPPPQGRLSLSQKLKVFKSEVAFGTYNRPWGRLDSDARQFDKQDKRGMPATTVRRGTAVPVWRPPLGKTRF